MNGQVATLNANSMELEITFVYRQCYEQQVGNVIWI